MIEARSLVKHYGRQRAVDSIDLTIRPGEIYGFLGPNGAGKTSTINMLVGLLKPTSGEILLFGERYGPHRLDLRRRIGVVPEKHPVGAWSWMTGREYLEFFADFFQVADREERIDFLLDRVGLADSANKRFGEYSRGMLQKLSIIRALLHDPDILFLDEPVSGLDPLGIKQVRDLILEENREGRTLFISSHLLSEMEKICHRVAVIHRGRVVIEDEMKRLLDTLVPERRIRVELENIPSDLVDRIRALPFVQKVTLEDAVLEVSVLPGDGRRGELSRFLIGEGLVPTRIEESAASLEEAFVAITSDTIELFSDTGKDL